MKTKDVIIIALLLAIAVLAYTVGFRDGQRKNDELRSARARLGLNLNLYRTAQSGDLAKVVSDLGVVILAQTRTFEREFDDPTSSNAFGSGFTNAQAIAAQVERRMVPMSSLLTNFPHSPDAKVTVGREEK